MKFETSAYPLFSPPPPPPPPTHTSLSIPTFIRTCFSQVSKVKVYIFLFKAPSFCAFDFIACCLLQDYTLFCYFHALLSLSRSSYARDMFMGLAFLNEQSNNTSHRPHIHSLYSSLLSFAQSAASEEEVTLASCNSSTLKLLAIRFCRD